jgi:hypothetical protein
MTQGLSTRRRIVRAIHAGIAGVFFIMIPAAIAGDEDLRDAILQRNWNELMYLGSWLAFGLVFLAVALQAQRANLVWLSAFVLLDLPMIYLFWESIKGLLLAPVLAVSVICLLVEISKLVAIRKKQPA